MRSPLFQSSAGHWFRLTLQGTLVPAADAEVTRERARMAEDPPIGRDQGVTANWAEPLEAGR